MSNEQKISNGVNKKNQWRVKPIEEIKKVKRKRVPVSNKNGINPLGFQKKLSQTQNEILKSLCWTCFSNKFRNIASQAVKGGLTVLISVLIIFTVVQAGTITPPSGTPTAKFYTLSEIYTRLTTNATSTEGGHSFTFADSLEGTGRTLTEVYSAIPTIDPAKLLSDTTYLGVTGSVATQTLSVLNDTVAAGYYAATTLSAVDSDLATGNIKSGITIFGIDGNGNVVDTSTGDAVAGDILSAKKAWVGGLEITGNIANCSSEGSQSCYAMGTYFAGTSKTASNSATSQSAGYYPAFDLATVDTDLTASKIMADVSIFGVSGTLLKNLFTGTDRSDRLSTVTLNVGGSGYTPGAQVLTVTQSGASGGAVNVTVDAGGVVTSVDSIATTGKVYSVANGLATTGGGGTGATVNITAITSHYPITVGGVDDYNDNGTMPADSYTSTWTTCAVGNNYCGTNDLTNANKKDDSTGLVWSIRTGTSDWFVANNCKYPNNGLLGDDGACGTNGEVACKCVKLPEGSMTGCETLGAVVAGNSGGWRLPSQKELMQAYINGSWGNLSLAGYDYWSATTKSNYTYYAWYTNLTNGNTYSYTKTNTTLSVRCVR